MGLKASLARVLGVAILLSTADVAWATAKGRKAKPAAGKAPPSAGEKKQRPGPDPKAPVPRGPSVADQTKAGPPSAKHGGVVTTLGPAYFLEFVKKTSEIEIWLLDPEGNELDVSGDTQMTVFLYPENRPMRVLGPERRGDHWSAAVDLDGVLRLKADLTTFAAGKKRSAHVTWGLLDNKNLDHGNLNDMNL